MKPIKPATIAFLLVTSAAVANATSVIFKCGNHTPRHSTSSAAEAKELARKNGCSGWDVSASVGKLNDQEIEKALAELEDALTRA